MESEFRGVIDALPGLVWTSSPDGFADFVNQRWLEYTGLSAEDAVGAGWQGALHPEDRTAVLGRWREHLERGEPAELEARLRRHDGEYRWFSFRFCPVTDASGRITKWCGVNTDIEDLKRADEAARASEHRFRSILEGLPVGVTLTTPDGQLAYGNLHVTNFLGVSLDELTTRPITERYHPDDRWDVDRRWKHSAETGEPYDHEARLAGADGIYRWVHTRGFPLRDPDGRIALWYLLQEDVDDRRRTDAALRDRERNLQLIMDTTPALIWSALPDGLTDSVNRYFLDYLGSTFEQLKDDGWAVAIHPDDQNALVSLWNRIRTAGIAGQAEARLRRHDGEYRWFLLRASPLRDENGNIVKWYGVNIDIEDLKQAETELSRREAFLHQGEAVSETGSFLWRVEANEIKWSDQLYRIFAVEPGTPVTFELMGSRVHPEDRQQVADLANQALAGRDFEYEHRLLLPDGSVRYLHATSHATRDQHGRLEYVGAAQDVTARRLSEQALSKVRSELARVTRVTSLGALAASIAHEVNQPLSGIVTNASTCLRMLAADPPNLEGARANTQRLLRDGNRAAEVIQHLRSLFENKQPTNGPVDLNDAAREVLALSSSELRAGGLVVRTEFDDVPEVRGDRVQLQQVILNLILNAADAMKTIDDRPRDLLVTTIGEDKDRVRLSVCDSGIGINPLNVEELFDAFYTTKSKGMGVGLSISRSIIESHDGRLWATANDGPGATFSFSLPCGLGLS